MDESLTYISSDDALKTSNKKELFNGTVMQTDNTELHVHVDNYVHDNSKVIYVKTYENEEMKQTELVQEEFLIDEN